MGPNDNFLDGLNPIDLPDTAAEGSLLTCLKLKQIEEARVELENKFRAGQALSEFGNMDIARELYLNPFGVFKCIHSLCCRRIGGLRYQKDDRAIDLYHETLEWGIWKLMDYTEQVKRLRQVKRALHGKAADNPEMPGQFSPLIKRILDYIGVLDKAVDPKGFHALKATLDLEKGERYDIYKLMARFMNLSSEQCHRYTNRTAFSELSLRRIFFCLIMRSLLACQLKDEFLPFPLDHSIRGWSRLERYFDGTMAIGGHTLNKKVYLVKLSTLGLTGISMINDFAISLKDVEGFIDMPARGILFVPDDPSAETQLLITYWRNIHKLDIIAIYLVDFFELFRLWDRDAIRRFFLEESKW